MSHDQWFPADDDQLPPWEDELPPLSDDDYSPPSEEWQPEGDDGFVSGPSGPVRSSLPTKKTRPEPREGELDVVATLRRVLAGCHHKATDVLSEVVQQIRAAEQVLERLDDDDRKTYDALLELLLDTATNSHGVSLDFEDIPLRSLYDRGVREEIDRIAAVANAGIDVPADPSLEFFALREAVQRERAKWGALRYVKAIEQKAPVEDLVKKFSKVEPPTTRKASTRSRAARSVNEMAADHRLATSGQQKIRLSSGYRTMDIALTGSGDPLGFIGLGEGMVVAGPTGTGKSSWTYGVVPSATQDLINWGKPYGKVMFFHTEEESIDKAKAMMVLPGQSLNHLADNLVVTAIGTSRKLMLMAIYDVVLDASIKSRETGLPITEFLPYLVVLDYIQSLSEHGESETVATATTAELGLRGIQAWNPDEMAKFGGISYREYTGSPWPEGMENHRVAVIYMAQLVKQDDKSLLFRPGARDVNYGDFALEDTDPNPAWRDPSGGGWSWEVQENDLRLFKQNAIRGSGIILQNATTILILHRSRAYNNPALPDVGPDGRRHLSDTRSRFLLDKVRTGSQLKFVPMAFDLDPDGFRARYIDAAAEEAMRQGRFQADSAFQRSGDPILPRRPAASPLAKIRY